MIGLLVLAAVQAASPPAAMPPVVAIAGFVGLIYWTGR